MTAKKFIFITFLTILYFFLGRIIGWTFFAKSKYWLIMVNDKLHHYQSGALLLLVAFLFLKPKNKLREYFLAVGSGMIIDESSYLLFNLKFDNSSPFSHYHPVGILTEFGVFIIFSLVVLKLKNGETFITKSRHSNKL